MGKYKQLLMAASGVLFFTGLAVADDTIDQEVAKIDASAIYQGESKVRDKISSDFTGLAGSPENARALVTGLRKGEEFTVSDDNWGMVSYTPPTGPMGYGNAKIALALAKTQLEEDYTTIDLIKTLDKILRARTERGMGWGEIAKDIGVTVGQLIGKADKGLANQPIHSEKSANL